jgi:hypothetical protein
MALRDSRKHGSKMVVPRVIPAQAAVQWRLPSAWIPAFAGMTVKGLREFLRESRKANQAA